MGDYEEVNVGEYRVIPPQDAAKFIELRDSEQLTFDQFPLWEEYDGDVKTLGIVQSRAIVRHLARSCNLYGTTLAEQAKVDEILDHDPDAYMALLFKAAGSTPRDEESLAKVKEAMKASDVPKHLGFFERILRKNEGSQYSVGNGLTVADIVIWRTLDEYQSNELVNKDELSTSYPLLHKLYDHLLASIPSFEQYVTSPKRPLVQYFWIANPLELSK